MNGCTDNLTKSGTSIQRYGGNKKPLPASGIQGCQQLFCLFLAQKACSGIVYLGHLYLFKGCISLEFSPLLQLVVYVAHIAQDMPNRSSGKAIAQKLCLVFFQFERGNLSDVPLAKAGADMVLVARFHIKAIVFKVGEPNFFKKGIPFFIGWPLCLTGWGWSFAVPALSKELRQFFSCKGSSNFFTAPADFDILFNPLCFAWLGSRNLLIIGIVKAHIRLAIIAFLFANVVVHIWVLCLGHAFHLCPHFFHQISTMKLVFPPYFHHGAGKIVTFCESTMPIKTNNSKENERKLTLVKTCDMLIFGFVISRSPVQIRQAAP